jgi:Fe-S oxidoreductase
VDFAILGPEEACCGDPARRIGNEYLYQTLVQQNVENMKNHGIKKILVHCPHCFNTLKNEYSQFEGKYEVVHTTAFFQDLIAKGKLSLTEELKKNIVYHDSCYIGRYNNIYEPPRALLAGIPGVSVHELSFSREKSFCCGAGGGRMWMEETLGTRINKKRVEQALAQKPDIISANCPYCLTMLSDGIKDLNMDEKVQALDLMELLAGACAKEKAPKAQEAEKATPTQGAEKSAPAQEAGNAAPAQEPGDAAPAEQAAGEPPKPAE